MVGVVTRARTIEIQYFMKFFVPAVRQWFDLLGPARRVGPPPLRSACARRRSQRTRPRLAARAAPLRARPKQHWQGSPSRRLGPPEPLFAPAAATRRSRLAASGDCFPLRALGRSGPGRSLLAGVPGAGPGAALRVGGRDPSVTARSITWPLQRAARARAHWRQGLLRRLPKRVHVIQS
jgi:hypothetical protein